MKEYNAIYQIDVSLILVIKFRNYLGELAKNLIVPGHIGGKYTPYNTLSHSAIRSSVERGQNITLRVLKYSECNRAVVILKW